MKHYSLAITKNFDWCNMLPCQYVSVRNNWTHVMYQLLTKDVINTYPLLIFNQHDFVPKEEELKELRDFGYLILLIKSSRNLGTLEYKYIF